MSTMGSHFALILVSCLLAASRPTAHIRPQGQGTLEVLGYDPGDRRVYYIEEHGHAREPAAIYACALRDRFPEKRSRLAALEDDAAHPESLERRIRDLRKRLTPLEPATAYDLIVQAWPLGTHTVATSHGPLVRSHLGLDLRDGDLHARTRIVTSCEARTGITALYRIPGDRRALAILAYTGIPESTCVDVEEPIVLAPPDTSARHRSYSPTTSPVEGTATLAGRVSSPRGNPMEMVSVSVAGTKLGVYTDAEGWFTIHGIPPGPQVIMFHAVGFRHQTVRDTLVAGPNALLHVEMPSPLFVTDRPDYSGRCEPWFGLTMHQGDRAIPPGAMLLDEVGNIPRATLTRPEGRLAISSVEDPCVLAITWTPARTAPARVLVLDERGNVVREFTKLQGGAPTQLRWDGCDARGARCLRGSYVVEVRTDGAVLALECGRVGT
jgi:hypothetical protein